MDIARRLHYSYSWRATSDIWWVTGNVTAARSSEWAQHFSNASCYHRNITDALNYYLSWSEAFPDSILKRSVT